MTDFQKQCREAETIKSEFHCNDIIRILHIAEENYHPEAVGKLAVVVHVDDAGQVRAAYDDINQVVVCKHYGDKFEKFVTPYDCTTEKLCPICKTLYTDYPALSRRDNKTYLCPKCGMHEAICAMKIKIKVVWDDRVYIFNSYEEALKKFSDLEGNFDADGETELASMANQIYNRLLNGETDIKVLSEDF